MHNIIIQDLLRLEGKNLNINYGKAISKEYFVCQTNGVISDSIVQNWTPQALECYKINCRCEICPITKAGYSFKCQMKNIVDILLKTQGLPDEQTILNNTSEQKEDSVA